jgi:hypothetical protein
MRSRQRRFASHTGVPVEMPKRFASTDAGDGDRRVRTDGRDDDRPTAQGGLELLLDGGEIGIEVEEQPAERARRRS